MSSLAKEIPVAAVRRGVDAAKHNTAIPEDEEWTSGLQHSALDFSDDPNAEHSRY